MSPFGRWSPCGSVKKVTMTTAMMSVRSAAVCQKCCCDVD